MNHLCSAYIDLKALQHNLGQVRQLAPKQKIIAMIKGNAYGHGIRTIGKALAKVDALGVARLTEAVALREAGVVTPIVLMEGFTASSDIPLIETHQLDFVIHQQRQLDILEQQRLATPRHAWLKVDTGMHRLGLDPEQVNATYQRMQQCHAIHKDFGIMTHFAKAEELNGHYTKQQLQIFNHAINEFKAPISLANSAAIMAWPQSHGDWVRPGIMLYGVSPFANEVGADRRLKPVMTLQSEIIAIKELKKGDAVGYGCTWQCPEDMRIGVIAVGYGDGYPRYIQNGAPVLLNQQCAALIGRVSMDMITIDLRYHPRAKIGDRATLWGEGLPVEEIARWANTSPYELLCGVTQRVKFFHNREI